MRRTLITALTWLLIAAVPVRAMAASAMVHCAHEHAGSAQSHAASASHEEVGGLAHLHDPAEGGAIQHSHSHSKVVNSDKSDLANFANCSACASCCVGAALPVTTRLVVVPPPRHSPMLSPFAPVLDIFVPGPERPPRFSLV